jgi:predicted transcriptional regulator
VEVLETELGVVKTELGVVKTELGVVKTELGVVKTELGVVKTELGVVKTELGVVKTDLSTVKTKLDVVETELTDVKYHVILMENDNKLHHGALHDGYQMVYDILTKEIRPDIASIKKRLDDQEMKITWVNSRKKKAMV